MLISTIIILGRPGRARISLPVAEGGVELDDDVLFLLGDVPPLDVRPKVVDPPQPAALAAPEQPCTSYHQQEKLTWCGDGLII